MTFSKIIFTFVGFMAIAIVAAFRPLQPEKLYLTPETYDNEIIFISDDSSDIPSDLLQYSILDYNGNTIAHGELKSKGNGQFGFVSPVSQTGFYEIFFSGLQPEQRIGYMIADELPIEQADAFFGMDTCFSGFELFNKEENLKTAVDILQRNAIPSIRERFNWFSCHPDKDSQLDCDAQPIRHKSKREIENSRGLQILEMFHLPNWWIPSLAGIIYPQDLIHTANEWKEISRQIGHTWSAFEVWNEPDAVTFGQNLPGCIHGSLLRTMAYTLRNSDIQIPIVSGAFCPAIFSTRVYHGNMPVQDDIEFTRNVISQFLENGLLDSADALSFHSYERPGSIAACTSTLRNVIQQSERRNIPIWITEAGYCWDGKSGMRATISNDIDCAKVIAAKALEAKAAGIARFYTFVMNHYTENTVNNAIDSFGLIDGYFTPQRSFCAYATAARKFAHYQYVGELSNIQGAEFAWGFTASKPACHDTMIVLYDDDNDGIVLPSHLLQNANIFGADGRVLYSDDCQDRPEEEIFLQGDGIYYLALPGNTIQFNQTGILFALNQEASLWNNAPVECKPIVIQYCPNDKAIWGRDGFVFPDNESMDFEIKFNNVSDEEITIRPAIRTPLGIKISSDLPKTITIAPKSYYSTIAKLTISRHEVQVSPDKANIIVLDENQQAAQLKIRIGITQWTQTATVMPIVDGNDDIFSDDNWDSQTFIPITTWESLTNDKLQADIAAKFAIKYDDSHLYFRLIINDANGLNQPYSSNEMWQGDSVQIGIQTGHGIYFSEICCSLCNDVPAIFNYFSEKGKHLPVLSTLKSSSLCISKRNDDYYYDIALDMNELGCDKLKPNDNLSCTILVNSSDGTTRRGYLTWGDGIGGPKSTCKYNRLILVPTTK